MTARTLLALPIAIAALTPLVAQQAAPSKTARPAHASAPIFKPAADLNWSDLDPNGAPGVKIADLWGDHAKGAFGAFLKLPAGFAAPLHTHTHDMKVVIVSGTYLQAPAGKAEVRLGPGSYMLQPGGNYQHTTSCDKSADCVFFVESSGAFDLKPVAAGTAPAKK